MLLCIGLLGLLMYNAVVTNAVCSFTYSQKDEIKALSQIYHQKGYRHCEYHIRAPKNTFIELNFTRFFGFRLRSPMTKSRGKVLSDQSNSYDDSNTCVLPEVIVTDDSDSDNYIGRICTGSRNLRNPIVFQSKLNVVKITYTWVENHSSGFNVKFDFHHNNSSCVQTCDDQVCLSQLQVCNGLLDCADQTDEHNCPPLSPSTSASSSTADVDVIKAFAVLISLVLMPGLLIILCVVSPCHLRSRMFRGHRRSRDGLEHSQLRPDSQVSEVVYVPVTTPSTSQDKLLERQISAARQHQERVRSVQTDTMLDLPPQIPISKDGEESFIDSQKHLIGKKPKYIDQLFRPPPNKTVHDRESPPPYYSNSPSLENLRSSPATRIFIDSDGCTRVSRCNSMSSNVAPVGASSHRTVQKQTAKSHSRTLSTNVPSAGPRRNMCLSASPNRRADEPPGYESMRSSDNNNQLSLRVDSV